jgi:hypothetical protein
MLWRVATLWLGMYAITVSLFWYESGQLTTGLVFGLASATLKSLWSLLHKYLCKDKELEPPIV